MLVTFDKHFSYPKLVKAASYAKKPDNLFLATNEDPNLPLESKEIVIPGKCVWGRDVWGRDVWGRDVWGRDVWGRDVWGRDVWGRDVWGRDVCAGCICGVCVCVRWL